MNRHTYYVDESGIVQWRDPAWQEAYADVNITYGGLWIKDYGDYADVLEVTDIDSATGAPGRVLVDIGSVGFYTRSASDAVKRLRSALSSAGCGADALLGMTGNERRLAAWEAMWNYGLGDREESRIIAHDSEAALAETAYGFNDIDATVEGEEGLRAYLASEFNVPMPVSC